jgi:hypothetical protein
MATAAVSSDSESECEVLCGLIPGRIPIAYAWQPTRPAASSSSDSDPWTSASSEESGSEGGASDRLGNVDAWCQCGLCETATLSQEKEAIFCSSVANCRKRMAEGLWNIFSCFMIMQNCITWETMHLRANYAFCLHSDYLTYFYHVVTAKNVLLLRLGLLTWLITSGSVDTCLTGVKNIYCTLY